MTLYNLATRIGLLSTLAALSVSTAFAADTPASTEPPALSDADVMSLKPDAPPAAQADKPQAAGRLLPKITVRWACGSCTHNEKVPPLLTQTYEQEAQKRGYTISNDETADVAITVFEQRSPAMRFMFGAMSGEDKLAIRTTFKGRSFEASSYHANALFGMNDLCKVVMNDAFSKLVAAIPVQ